jgi:hypothetical protein
MPPVWWNRRSSSDHLEESSVRQLRDAYREIQLDHGGAADAAARAERADRIAAELLRRQPDDGAFWFDRGLLAKWRQDWPAAQEFNARALALVPAGEQAGEPAAWNLGIAATARRDWATARTAWTTFGLSIFGDRDDPIAEDFGMAPVRLNPPPRFVGRQEMEVDGRRGDTEVVWGRRIDPARIQLASVPLPGSGHRHGDVVLHDGDPHGARTVDDEEFPVFDAIELWERSPRPTLSVVLRSASGEDVEDLLSRLDDEGLAGEDWTTTVRTLCAACSEGAPGSHDHLFGSSADGDRTVGLSGDVEDAQRILELWRRGGPGRDNSELTVELE